MYCRYYLHCVALVMVLLLPYLTLCCRENVQTVRRFVLLHNASQQILMVFHQSFLVSFSGTINCTKRSSTFNLNVSCCLIIIHMHIKSLGYLAFLFFFLQPSRIRSRCSNETRKKMHRMKNHPCALFNERAQAF